MAKVTLWGALADLAEGQSDFEVDVPTIHKLFQYLADLYPQLETELDQNVSVSINGQIYRDSLFVKIAEQDEVFILPKLQGG